MVGRVCIIGAGPSGLAVLSWIEQLKTKGKAAPEPVCYEKQSDWGGQWNYTWRTGTDQYGEHVHSSMYRYLWSNGPKECLELPYYTFEEHFGRAIPSFPPRAVISDYLNGLWTKMGVRKYIRFSTVVRDVCYNQETDDFSVLVKDLVKDEVCTMERFDYVVVAVGHFSVPNVPSFSGIEKFPGRVLHAHDFRDANEFAGKRILLVGAGPSAEDLALQCHKYGAKEIVISWRTLPMGFNWPAEICERPLIHQFIDKKVIFIDGAETEVDVVILCTGYLHSYPFLRENLRLKSRNVFCPPNLYKGMLWLRGGNNRLFYIGTQDQCYTFTMFDACGLWIAKLLAGEFTLPDREQMDRDWKRWTDRLNSLEYNCLDYTTFQTDYVKDVLNDCGGDYPYDVDAVDLVAAWLEDKDRSILTYRDQSFTSKYTGTKSPVHHTPFMQAMDDSLETFLNPKS